MTRALAILILLAATACADSLWMTPSQQDTYAATQAVVNERIAKGTMTPAEGKMVMAKLHTDMEDSARGRMAYGATTYQRTGPNTVVAY